MKKPMINLYYDSHQKATDDSKLLGAKKKSLKKWGCPTKRPTLLQMHWQVPTNYVALIRMCYNKLVGNRQ